MQSREEATAAQPEKPRRRNGTGSFASRVRGKTFVYGVVGICLGVALELAVGGELVMRRLPMVHYSWFLIFAGACGCLSALFDLGNRD